MKQLGPCPQGHTQRYALSGACIPCARTNAKRYYKRENNWRVQGTLNENGMPFNQIDYDRLYQLQQGKCAICGKHQSDITKTFHVDHSHITGKVRGLLCDRCNRKLLPVLEDCPELIQAGFLYLKGL